MINKKRILTIFLCLLMVICSVFSFAACNDEDDPKSITSISVVYTQGEEVVDTNTSLDELKDSIVVTLQYSDGTTETITDYTLSGTLTEGESVITVSYKGFEKTFTVNVSEELDASHSHTLARNEAKTATCTEDGNIEYWSCSSCGKYYADQDGVREIALSETVIEAGHTGGTEIRNSKSPSETEEGYTGDTYCLGCGEKIATGETIDKLGHTHALTKTNAISATCTENGNIEYWSCSSCGKYYADQNGETEIAISDTVIVASHNGGTEIRNSKAPSESEEGYTGDTYCLGCGEKIATGETIDKLDHTHVMTKTNSKNATCTENGNIEYWSCSSCGKYYADQDGIREITLSETVIAASHNLTHHEAKSATCTVDGNIEYWSCSACNKNYSDASATTEIDTVVVAASHNLTHHEAKSATCTVDGNIEYWYCSACNKSYSDANATTEVTDTVIEATHTGGTEIRNSKAPSESEEGYTGDTYCLGCGEKIATGETIDKLDHTHVMTKTSRKEATCTEDGNIEYWSCSSCGKHYADQDGVREIALFETVIAASHSLTHHEAKTATCTVDGNIEYWSCSACSRNYSDATATTEVDTVVVAASHSLTHHEAKSATCTVDGNIEYWSCSACNKNYSDASATTEVDTVIVVASHSLTHHEAKSATCTVDGNIEYWSCSACNKNYSDANATTEVATVVVAASHNLTHHEATAATCTVDGNIEYWSCSACNKNYSDANATTEVAAVVVAASHSLTHHEAKTATCTEDGNIEYWSCSVCNKKYLNAGATSEVVEVVITATHTLTRHGANSATCTENGNIEYWSCSDCGKNFSNASGTTEVSNVVIEAAHTLTHHQAVTATCTEDGNIEYWSCSACKKNYSNANATTEVATVVIAASHNLIHHEANAATCVNDGNIEYWSCSACDKKFSNEDSTDEITTVVVSKTGLHDYDSNGICTNCGAERVVDVWDGTVATGFGSGDGSVNNPYIISSGAEFAYFISAINSGVDGVAGSNFSLVCDIDFNNIDLNIITSAFSGFFDGNGNTLSNVKLVSSTSAYYGLFRSNSGTIQDLNITTLSVSVTKTPGTIYAGGLVAYNTGIVSNCSVSGTINYNIICSSASSATYNYDIGIGGMVGYNSGTIENSDTNVIISIGTCVHNGSHIYAGGFVGINEHEIDGCDVNATVSAEQATCAGENLSTPRIHIWAGGFAGKNTSTIKNSDVSGSVYASPSTSGILHNSGSEMHVGGFVSSNTYTASIDNCHTSASATATSPSRYQFLNYAGGFASDNAGTINNCSASGLAKAYRGYDTFAGGFIAYATNGSITNCSATGGAYAVSSTDSNNGYAGEAVAGGFIAYDGEWSYGTRLISNCYASGTVRCAGDGAPHGTGAGNQHFVGGFIGQKTSSSTDGDPIIENCYFTGSVSISGYGYASVWAGGFAGFMQDVTVNNCYSSGTVTATNTSEYSSASTYIGGFMARSACTTNYCYSTSDCTADSVHYIYAGGFIGSSSSSYAHANYCFATGDVYADSEDDTAYVGGFVGKGTFAKSNENYRSSEQSIAGKSDSSYTYVSDATISYEGSVATEEELLSGEFQYYTLKYSKEIWMFYEGAFPKLKYTLGIDGLDSSHALNYYSDIDETCQTVGRVAHYYCMDCNKCFSDALADKEITKASTIIAIAPHTNNGSWVYDEENHWHLCPVCNEKFDLGGHNYQDSYCVECNYYEFEGEKLEFELNGDMVSYSVKGIGTSVNTKLVIPSEYKGLPVTGISSSAFKGFTGLVSVVIPDTITSIGSSAFYGCTGITTITIPQSVTSIGSSAFYGCSNLAEVIFEESDNTSLSINSSAFAACTSLKEIFVPSHVTYMGSGVFASCTSLETISLPFVGDKVHTTSDTYQYPFGYIFGTASYTGGVAAKQYFYKSSTTSTSYSTFYIPQSLKNVTIYGGNILVGTFQNCTTVENIVITDAITLIQEGTFNGCTSLTSITMPFVGNKTTTSTDKNQYPLGYIFGTTSYTGGTATTQYYYGSSTSETTSAQYCIPNSLRTVIISTCTNIPYGAFYGCTKITNIELPQNATIGDRAFYNCSSLLAIKWPSAMTNISANMFYNCSSLRKVDLPVTLVSIEGNAFANCTSLTSIVIPDSVKTIGSAAFTGCKNLRSMTLPFVGSGSSSYASSSALFGYIFGTTSYTGGVSTKQYYGTGTNAYATYYIPSTLTNVTVTGGKIYYGAFYGCSYIESLSIGENVTYIGQKAFYGCSKLTDIVLPFIGTNGTETEKSDTTAFSYVFGSVPSSLSTVHILGGNILDGAFSGCSRIQSIDISNLTMDRIPNDAFYNCYYLTEVLLPNTITLIGNNAFYGCKYLEKYDVDSTVTSIGDSAFYNCTSLTSITIPSSVRSIGNNAFYGCSALTNVAADDINAWATTAFGNAYSNPTYYAGKLYINSAEVTNVNLSGIDHVSQYAFYNCGTLTSITITSSVKEIGAYAFAKCVGLTTLEIPQSVTSIGNSALNGCSGLTALTIPFAGQYVKGTSDTYLYPVGYLFGTTSYTGGIAVEQYYYGSDGYSDGSPDYYIPANLTTITISGGDILQGAFRNFTMLTSVILPSEPITVGNYAFYNCTALTDINLNKVTHIGNYAFSDCTALKTITILACVSTIGEYAFADCTSLSIRAEAYAAQKGWASKWNSSSRSVTWGCNAIQTNELYDYVLYGDAIWLTKYKGTSMEVVIPSELDGYTVKGFGEIFAGTKITSITVPNTVDVIAPYAFYGCSYLITANLPDCIEKIGSYAFYKCTKLSTFNMPTELKRIDSYAFAECMAIVTLTLPQKLEYIGERAFYYCSKVTTITVPQSLTYIGTYAFYYCNSITDTYYLGTLEDWFNIVFASDESSPVGGNFYINGTIVTEVTIPESVSKINAYAFKGWHSVKEFYIPDTVTSVGGYVFEDLDAIIFVDAASKPSGWSSSWNYTNCPVVWGYAGIRGITDDGYVWAQTSSNTITIIKYQGEASEIVIPSSINDCTVTHIAHKAFSNNQTITSVFIPETIIEIGASAFNKCENIATVYYDGDINSWCNIDFGSSASNPICYADSFYIDNVLITEVFFDSNITKIKSYSFSIYEKLVAVSIPATVTSIEENAFYGCKLVITYVEAASRPSGWNYSWSDSTIVYWGVAQSNILVLDGVEYILANGEITLTRIVDKTLTSVIIPNTITVSDTEYNVTKIGAYAFEGSNITSVVVPDSVISIGNYAFNNCVALETVTLGENSLLQTIGSYTFSGCTNLKSFTITDELISVGTYAFNNCTSLKTLIISDAGKFQTVSNYAFYGCSSLERVILPSGVTAIGNHAFAGCTSLTEVYIPNTVTGMYNDIFEGCTSLTKITIPYLNSNIGYLFGTSSYSSQEDYMPSSLKTVIVTGGTAISNYAFYECYYIEEVVFPDTITTMGKNIFYACKNLKHLTIPFVGDSVKTTESTYQYTFGYIFGTSSYSGGSSTKQYYYGSDLTKTTYATYYIPSSLESVTVLGGNLLSGAFYSCSMIDNIFISQNVEYVHGNALYGCSNSVILFEHATKPDTWGLSTTDYSIVWNYAGERGITDNGFEWALTKDGTIVIIGYSGETTTIVIPETINGYPVTEIAGRALYSNSTLRNVYIGNNIATIGNAAFRGSNTIFYVEHESLPIGWNQAWCNTTTVYWNVSDDTKVTIDGVDYVLQDGAIIVAMASTEVKNVELQQKVSLNDVEYTVSYIGNYAFYGCTTLESLTIPSAIMNVGNYAFYGCSALTSVTFNANSTLQTIGTYAFYNCSALVNVAIPSAVSNIGSYAFGYCNGLTEILIPISVDMVGSYAFSGCTQLKISVEASEKPHGWSSNWNSSSCEVLWSCNQISTNSDFDYVISRDGIILTKYKGTSNIVVIPSTIDGYNVIGFSNIFENSTVENVSILANIAKIDSYAFNGCKNLVNITLPESVTSIGMYAFSNCEKLANINIPTNVISIGNYAFQNCTSLATVTIAEGSKLTAIGDYTFYGCTALKTITIPSGVESIGTYAFYNCISLEGIRIPTDVITINSDAFSGCKNLKEVIFATDSQLQTIGSYAFYNCSALTQFTVPSSVRNIGNYAFQYCYELVEVYNLSTLGITSGGSSYGYIGYYALNIYTATEGTSALVTQGDYLFYNDGESCYLIKYLGNSTEIVLPESLNGTDYAIYQYAFANSGVTKVTIPANVIGIGNYAFQNCVSLTTVTIAEGSKLTAIGDYSFYGCTALETITIPTGVTSIGTYAFNNCSNLATVVISADSKLQTIGSYAFYGCSALESVTIPTEVTSIGSYAFRDCKNLTAVIFAADSKLQTIGSYAFYNCSALTQFTVPSTVTSISSNAFQYCYELVEIYNLSTLSITSGSSSYGYIGYYALNVYTATEGTSALVTQGDYLFYNDGESCYLIKYLGNSTEIVLPESLNGTDYAIYQYAFANSGVTKVTIPANVIGIGNYAFQNCASLTTVIIPDDSKLQTIGSYAFYGCTALESITIPAEVTSVGNYAFNNCVSLASIKFNAKNCNDLSSSNYVFAYAGNSTEGITVTIGNMVEKIPAYLFCPRSSSSYTPNIVSVVFETNSVCNSIGNYAFYYCGNLSNITLPNSVTSIGNYSFKYCSSLGSIIIPNAVTIVGNNCFSNTTTVFVQTASVPETWDASWNSDGCPVIYDYDGIAREYTFITNGGTSVEKITATYVASLPITSRDGYYFMGWYTDSEFSGDPVSSYYCSKTQTTLYAKWFTEEEYIAHCDGSSFEKAIHAENNKAYTVTIDEAGEYYYFSFVPTESTSYTIYSQCDTDTYGYLYAASQSQITSNDDGGEGNNFSITYELVAGETYYIAVRFYSSSKTGTFTVVFGKSVS